MQETTRRAIVWEPIPSLRTKLTASLRARGIQVHSAESLEDLHRTDAHLVVAFLRVEALDACRRLRDRGVSLIALRDSESQLAPEALIAAGAQVVLDRDPSPHVLDLAIDAGDAGLHLLEPARVTCPPEQARAIATLSDHQRDILRDLAEGTTVNETARRHGYSERTLYRHLRTLHRTLGTKTITQAVAVAAVAGIIS